MKLKLKVLIGIMCVLMLCACGTEPEDREFVTAVSISSGYKVSLLTAEGQLGEENDETNEGIISAEGRSIHEAVDSCNKVTAGELFFGHTSVCIVDKNLLKDGQKVKEMVEYMAEDTQISRRVVLLAADNPGKVLSGTSNGRDVADFVKEYYKTHSNEKPVELDKLCRALAENGDIVLPAINYDDGFELDGIVLMSNGVNTCELSSLDAEKVLWLLNDNTAQFVEVTYSGKNVSVNIKDKTVRVTPEEIDIRVRTDENEALTDSLTLTKAVENKIRLQAEEGLEILREYDCDVVNMRHALEKAGVDKTTNVLEGVKINCKIIV
jgi:hypothetical protein